MADPDAGATESWFWAGLRFRGQPSRRHGQTPRGRHGDRSWGVVLGVVLGGDMTRLLVALGRALGHASEDGPVRVIHGARRWHRCQPLLHEALRGGRPEASYAADLGDAIGAVFTATDKPTDGGTSRTVARRLSTGPDDDLPVRCSIRPALAKRLGCQFQGTSLVRRKQAVDRGFL